MRADLLALYTADSAPKDTEDFVSGCASSGLTAECCNFSAVSASSYLRFFCDAILLTHSRIVMLFCALPINAFSPIRRDVLLERARLRSISVRRCYLESVEMSSLLSLTRGAAMRFVHARQ